MGGPQRQTTPRTGLDDFVAGLLKYGTLGYLPPDVLNQLFAPVPGTPGGGGGGTDGGGGRTGDPGVPSAPGMPGMSELIQMLSGGGAPGSTPAASAGVPLLPGVGGPTWPGTGGGTGAGAPVIPGGSVPFDIGQFIQSRLSVPQYGGNFTAPVNALQTSAAAGGNSAITRFFSGGGGITTGNDILSNLLNRGSQGSQTPERSILDLLGIQGPQANLNSAFSALDTQRRFGLGRDVRDLREQFSATGNRFSSDLANAITNRQSESEANFLAQTAPLAAQLAPQLFGQQVSALGTAGQLGQGAGDQSLQALLAAPGAYSTTSMVPGQVAGQGFNLGEQLRQIMQGDVGARQAEFTRTQGALFPTLLQYAAGAPNIYTPGIGQQLLGAGTTVGASALGAK